MKYHSGRLCEVSENCAVYQEISFFRYCTKSTLIVWYFVSNKHYFIEQKRGKTKYVIFLVLGKLLKRWITWWSSCGSVSTSPSIKTLLRFIPPVYKEESMYICNQTYSYRTVIVNCNFVDGYNIRCVWISKVCKHFIAL